MKKILLLPVLLTFSLIKLEAQSYSFSKYNSVYADLISPVVVSSPNWDDFSVFNVLLPFNFNYFGANYDTVFAMGGFAGFVYDGNGLFGSYELYIYENSMVDFSGNATISYQVTGITPNRIMKIQTKNANFDDDNTKQDFGNVQLWLYEGSNIVEYHYGSYSVQNANTFQMCGGGLIGIIKYQSDFVMLSGPFLSPTPSSTSSGLCVTGVPTSGMVYKFVPTIAGISAESSEFSFRVFPNPCHDNIKITSGVFLNTRIEIKISNYLGETVFWNKINFPSEGIIVKPDLKPGVYFVNINSATNNSTQKIVIE